MLASGLCFLFNKILIIEFPFYIAMLLLISCNKFNRIYISASKFLSRRWSLVVGLQNKIYETWPAVYHLMLPFWGKYQRTLLFQESKRMIHVSSSPILINILKSDYKTRLLYSFSFLLNASALCSVITCEFSPRNKICFRFALAVMRFREKMNGHVL